MTELRWWLAALAEIKLTAADSGGAMTIVEVTEPPGAAAPTVVARAGDVAYGRATSPPVRRRPGRLPHALRLHAGALRRGAGPRADCRDRRSYGCELLG